jgi:thiol-disulfide isomerase/thioredoxin
MKKLSFHFSSLFFATSRPLISLETDMKRKHAANRTRRTFRTSSALLLALGAGSTLAPQPPHSANAPWLMTCAQAQAETQAQTQEEANNQLMMTLFKRETTPEEYDAALSKAKAAGIPAQVLLESQIVRTFYSKDKTALIALKTPLEKAGANLDLENSQMFQTKNDYDAMLEGIAALEAERDGDAAGFEKHIKEAIWQGSPMLQPMYLSWLNEYRAAAEMQKIVVPLDTKLMTSDGKQTTFKEVLGTNKALLIDFWASWYAPSVEAMDELKSKGASLAPQGVVVVGLNTENDAGKAAGVKKDKNIALPWLLEPEGEPYSRLLNVDSIPRAVLVSAEGKVLYNGHPADPALKAALAKVGAKL